MLRESYFSATSDKPLMYETIGACFDRLAHAFPEQDGLIVRHQNSRSNPVTYETGAKVGIQFEEDAARVLKD